jgi:hypothetical protein
MLTLRLIEDRLPAGADAVYLPATERALYVLDGEVTVETGTGSLHQAAGSAWLGDAALGLVAGSAGARLLRWELARADDPDTGVLRAAPHCTSTAKLAARVDLDPAFGWLMRCDRVFFPKSGIAYTHVHQGPGIRYCLEGSICIETEGQSHSHGPGEAWFESGSSPVLAPTSEEVETGFVRCFVLPRACKGRSSIRYVLKEDAAKPKTQRYRVLGERFIALPA